MTPTYIVDAHHHLWNLAAVDYPWLRQRGTRRFFGDPAPIQKDYGVAEFRSAHCGLNVGKSVHIQVGAAPGVELEETCWLETQADTHALPSAIIGFCDLSSATASEVIQGHIRLSRRIRGVRQIFSRHPDEDRSNGSPQLLANSFVLENLKLLASLRLSFDLQLTPPYMIDAARLIACIDGLQVGLCHAGSPWRRDADGLAEWGEGLRALAEIPTVTCKLSGLGMFDPHWTVESLQPIVLTTLETFGADRVMWGSNFPVDKLYRPYDELFSAMLAIVPQDMQDRVFRTTAERFYRI